MRAAFLALVVMACTPARGDSTRATGPVVVELFTSQGCSSCPPADAVLADLAKDASLAPLAFHVDYWDDLGWADPYAKPAWSDRQRAYGHALGGDRVYTPELVVGGAKGMVGSNRGLVRDAIAHAPAPALLVAHAAWGKTLAVTATPPKGTEVWIAVYEARVTNKVPRGENAGETLASVHVVRTLAKIVDGKASIAIDPAWKNVGAIAFAQRPDKTIVASAAL